MSANTDVGSNDIGLMYSPTAEHFESEEHVFLLYKKKLITTFAYVGNVREHKSSFTIITLDSQNKINFLTEMASGQNVAFN